MILNRPILLALISCSLLAGGCSHTAAAEGAPLTPSELNADSSRYSGKEVVVRGYLKLGPESHVLYESKEMNEEFERRWDSGDKDFDPNAYKKYCLTVANPDLLYKNRTQIVGKTLVVRGQFVSSYLDAQHLDLGACPLPTAIIINEADLKQRYHLH